MKYISRIARIDLNRGISEIVEIEDSLLRKYIGGVGVGAKIIWDETSASTIM